MSDPKSSGEQIPNPPPLQGPSISLEERSTERFGPVLVVKSETGQVLHVQHAHNFSTKGELGSLEEAQDTISEIQKQVYAAPVDGSPRPSPSVSVNASSPRPSPPDSVEATPRPSPRSTAAGNEVKTEDGHVPAPLSFHRGQTARPSSPTGGSGTFATVDAENAGSMRGGSPRPSISIESTQRFGDVVVVKNETGETIGIYPKSSKKLDDENGAASPTTDLDSPPTDATEANVAHKISKPNQDGGDHSKQAQLVRKFSDSIIREELHEFGNFRKMSWFKRTFYSIERDVFNWYGSFLSLINHGWGFESLLTLILAVGSTCFFCYYRTPDGTPLAARLDFSIIGSALVFPITFLIAETFRRREGAIQRLASIKAIICQIELALLTWRWSGPNTDLGTEWEDRVHQTLHHIINTMTSILKLPTWNTNRHIYTAQGREFKARVIKRERELTRRLGLLFSELHWYVEDLKEKGLPANEASRINQYNSILQIDFEALAMVKSYRTPNVSRSFVRIMVLVMPIFYGPYFAWVSGSIGSGAQTNPAFAIALTIVTVIVLLGLVRVQRSMEDPFTSHFPGDVIDLISEQLDTETRLNLIVACARERKRAREVRASDLNAA